MKILVEGKLRLAARRLAAQAMRSWKSFSWTASAYYFRELRGFEYDEVNAVLASGWDDLVDVEERLEAIQRGAADGEFRTSGGELQAHPEYPEAGAV